MSIINTLFGPKAPSEGELVQVVEAMFDTEKDTSRRILERIWWRNLLYYCLAEGTKVPLLDGRVVNIEDLADKDPCWVYGFDQTSLQVVPAEMVAVIETGVKPCVEVELDNGNRFTCTLDHRVLTWFGYEEAGKLSPGYPLIPWKSKFFRASGKGVTGGYNQTFQPYDAKWEQTHRMVARRMFGETITGSVIHHINEDKQDNRPENLQQMTSREHSTLTLTTHKDKILAGMTVYAQSVEGRKRKSENAKRQWAENREGMLKAVQGYRRDPVYRARVSEGVKKAKARWKEMGSTVNCRVVSVRPVGLKRVYDAVVPVTSNFALNAGVFVHNCGEQWIEWVRSTSSFRRRVVLQPQQTPVSNEIREYIRAVKSMLLNQKYIPRIVPNTEERADVDAADVGKDLLIYMDSINDYEIEDEKEKLAIGIGLWGTIFMRTIPFKDGGEWFIQKDGTVLTTGEVVSECVIPFNVVVDRNGDALRKKRWVGIQTLRNKEWVEDVFKVKVAGDTARAMVDYQRRLMSLVSQVSPWKGSGLDYIGADVDEDLVPFYEVEFQPNKRHPEGRYVIVCGGKLLGNHERMPIPAEKGYWTYSLTDFHFNYVPGRFWSDSGVDDLISPQNAINEIDKSLAENRKSLGRPCVVTPGELSMTRQSDKGDHVLVLQYDGLTSGGGKPVFQQGIPLPDQTMVERGVHKVQIQELGGDPKNILKGQAPSAHASGVMTDILRETAERGHYPDIDRYNRGMSRVYKSRLLVAKEVYTEQRVIKVKGRGNLIKVRQFKASDLRNNTDVRLEIDSGAATTKAGQRATLMDLLKLGFFQQDMATDPTIRHQLITRFGFSGFSDTTNGDIDRAERENSAVVAGHFEGLMIAQPTEGQGITPESEVVSNDPLFKYDTHAIHYEIHRRFMITPEFSDLDEQQQQALIWHSDTHHMQIEVEQAKALQQQMLMQGGGQGGPNAQGSPPNPNLETTGAPEPTVQGGMV